MADSDDEPIMKRANKGHAPAGHVKAEPVSAQKAPPAGSDSDGALGFACH